MKAQILENKVENTELRVQIPSLSHPSENQTASERFPAANSSTRFVQPEGNPRVSRQTLDFSFPTFSARMPRGSVRPELLTFAHGVPVVSPIAAHWQPRDAPAFRRESLPSEASMTRGEALGGSTGHVCSDGGDTSWDQSPGYDGQCEFGNAIPARIFGFATWGF